MCVIIWFSHVCLFSPLSECGDLFNRLQSYGCLRQKKRVSRCMLCCPWCLRPWILPLRSRSLATWGVRRMFARRLTESEADTPAEGAVVLGVLNCLGRRSGQCPVAGAPDLAVVALVDCGARARVDVSAAAVHCAVASRRSWGRHRIGTSMLFLVLREEEMCGVKKLTTKSEMQQTSVGQSGYPSVARGEQRSGRPSRLRRRYMLAGR